MSETTFKEAWGVLQRHASTLRNQSEPNIDDLLRIVTESVQAYKVCQSRVEAVEKALEEALKGSSGGPERPADPAAARTTSVHSFPDDDEMPF